MSIAIRRNVRRAGAALMAAVVAAALCLNAAMPAHADDKQKSKFFQMMIFPEHKKGSICHSIITAVFLQ